MKRCFFVVFALSFLVSDANGQEIDKEFLRQFLTGQAYWQKKLNTPRTYSGSLLRTKEIAMAEQRIVIHFDRDRLCIETFSESNSNRSHVVRVFAKNYNFTIKKPESNQPFYIVDLSKIQSTYDEQRALVLASIYADQFIRSPVLTYDIPLEEVFEQKKWTITGIEKIASLENSEEDYRIHAKRIEDGTYYDTLSFVVSSRFNFGVTSFEMAHRKSAGNIVTKIFGSVDYIVLEDQSPELSRVEIVESGFESGVKRADLERKSICKFDSIENACRKDVFTLPDFGIPDVDHLTTGKKNISKHWLLVVFSIVLCLGGIYYYSRKR